MNARTRARSDGSSTSKNVRPGFVLKRRTRSASAFFVASSRVSGPVGGPNSSQSCELSRKGFPQRRRKPGLILCLAYTQYEHPTLSPSHEPEIRAS